MTLKERIIDAAYDLFGEKGYDQTSVAEIIQRAQASKGGFYHHFKSKEEILETITFNYIDMIRDHYSEILKDNHLSVVDKFVESYYRLNAMKVDAVKDWQKIKNLYTFKGNHLLLRRMGERFEVETVLFYTQLIEEGVAQCNFKVDYPSELGALWAREVIKFQQMSRKALLGNDEDQASFYRTLAFNEALINQQLGLHNKEIKLVDMGKAYLTSMQSEMKGKVT